MEPLPALWVGLLILYLVQTGKVETLAAALYSLFKGGKKK